MFSSHTRIPSHRVLVFVSRRDVCSRMTRKLGWYDPIGQQTGLCQRLTCQSPNWAIIIDTIWLISCRSSGGLGTPMPERTGPRVSLMNPNSMSVESYPSNAPASGLVEISTVNLTRYRAMASAFL